MRNKLLTLLIIVGFVVLYACKKDSFLVPPATTEPGFTYTLDNNQFAPATATFTNTTVVPERAGEVTYYWNFGDSTFTSDINPTHFYERPGAFVVTLVAISTTSSEIAEFQQTLVIIDPNGSGTAVYFTDGGNVYSSYLNDQAPIFITLYGGLDDSYGLVVDTVENQLYVSDEGSGGKIIRSNLDGTDQVDWRTGLGVVDQMVIDHKMHQIYFENEDGIRRADMTVDTPTQYEDVVTGQTSLDPEGLAIDSVHRKLYWNTYNAPGGVWMKDLDVAGGETQIIPGATLPDGGGGSIIVVNDKIFYDDYDKVNGFAILRSAKLNGSGVATVATDITKVVFALAYDKYSNKVFWGDRGPGIIMRADPDGSNPEPWYTKSGSSPRGLVFGRLKQ